MRIGISSRNNGLAGIVTVACVWTILVLGGCSAGNGEGLDVNGRPLDEGGGSGSLSADFDSIQASVFTPACTVCHAGAGAPLGLRLDAGSSYAMLVGVPSEEVPELRRVKPGQPDDSYLIAKLEGTAAVGGRMPLGSAPLPEDSIAVIRQWIADGAPESSPSPGDPDAPVRVVSVTPGDGATLSQLPPAISVVFSHDMDAASIDSASITLVRSSGDGVFGDNNNIAIAPDSFALSQSNPRLLSIALPTASGVDDAYRLRLTGDGEAAFRDVRGEALDGNIDNEPGGDYLTDFVVDSATAPGQGGSAWETIQANVLTPSCTVCHAGSDAPEGLRLDDASSYSMLVGVSSSQVLSLDRVTPGEPDNSYLIHKLEGTASVGQRMPRGGTPLPQATIDFIRQWIVDGAMQTDNSPPPPAPPPADELMPTWRSIQDMVFTPVCTECHIGGNAPADLRLDENNSYRLLVNERSDEDSGILRVAPGNADDSYLIQVLEGTAEDTPRMPFQRTPLPQSTIDTIRAWIDAGASP